MSFNPKKPCVGLDITNPDDMDLFLELETSHMPPYGYADIPNNVLQRSNACASIKEFGYNGSCDPAVPFLAMNHYDNFISTHLVPAILDNPVANFRLFVTCCFTLATKTMNPNGDITGLLGDCFKTYDLYTMEHEIDRWLETRSCKRPITSLAFLDFFIDDLLNVDNTRAALIKNFATHRAYAQQYDIQYTIYKPSILAATAILYSCGKFFWEDYNVFVAAIYDAHYLDDTSLTQALQLYRPPIVVSSTSPPLPPLLLGNEPIHQNTSSSSARNSSPLFHDNPPKLVKYEPESGKGKSVWVDTDICSTSSSPLFHDGSPKVVKYKPETGKRSTSSPPLFHRNKPFQYLSSSPPLPPLFDYNEPVPVTAADLQRIQDVLNLPDNNSSSSLPPYHLTFHDNGDASSSYPDSVPFDDNELIDDTASSFLRTLLFNDNEPISSSRPLLPLFHDNQPIQVDKPPNVANIETETLKRVRDLVRDLSNEYNLICSSPYRPGPIRAASRSPLYRPLRIHDASSSSPYRSVPNHAASSSSPFRPLRIHAASSSSPFLPVPNHAASSSSYFRPLRIHAASSSSPFRPVPIHPASRSSIPLPLFQDSELIKEPSEYGSIQNALQAGTSASNTLFSPSTPPRFSESNTINSIASIEAAPAAAASEEEEDCGEESKHDVSSTITPALPPDDADFPPKKRRLVSKSLKFI